MNEQEISRRALMFLAVGGTAALAGCTAPQAAAIQQVVTNLINEVQAGVANACAQYGKFVPTANSVLAVLIGVVGAINPAIADITAATAAMVQTAITTIVGVACKTAPPPVAGAEAKLGATPIHVLFY